MSLIKPRAATAAFTLSAALALAAQSQAEFPAEKQIDSVLTSAGAIAVEHIVGDLDNPWGMDFLPDGRLLITERSGNLRILGTDGELSDPVQGTPVVYAQGQGGLMDVAVDPDFNNNQRIYLSFAAPGPEGSAATALGHGRLSGGTLEDFEVIFQQKPWITGPNHFGNRIAFDDNGQVFLALGDRFQFDPAQSLDNHIGKVVRLNEDGSIPEDNPFVRQKNAEPAIWSYGHRNIEAAAVHPKTGALWVMEMGPLGGDELNQPQAGKNYGWPTVSWGIHYDGKDIPDPTTRPEFADAIEHFSPVVSPSGMIFYSGDKFPSWRGSALIGGLSAQELVRLKVEGDRVTDDERIPLAARIRDVEQGPTGDVFVLTGPKREHGALLRLTPLK